MKPMTGRELLLILVGVAGIFGYLRWDAKRDGRREADLSANAQHVHILEDSLKVARAQFTVDTVKVFRRITQTDSVFREIVKADTLRLTDTVKVTVEVVREAVATLNACRVTVRECGELRAKEQARGDSLAHRVTILEGMKPSLLSRCGLSVGYGASDKGAGPAVLMGCRVAP